MTHAPRGAEARKLTLLPLIFATFFMVAGGPYGLEELIQKTGYRTSLLILFVTPLIWALPTALMVGELSSAIPQEGGLYAWVTRAMGPFWGFQEAWLSLMASIFDMAIYPTLFVLYLGRLWPQATAGHNGVFIEAGLTLICVLWNLFGSSSVGAGSVWIGVALLCPFLVLAVIAMGRTSHAATAGFVQTDLLGGILIAMWNTMGWDNASTVAGEVHRPQRTYPLAMIGAVCLVTITYMFPVWAISFTGIDPSSWDTGSWVDAAGQVGGRGLSLAVVVGGMLCGFGMLNALVMSYSRIPFALAIDGFLPKAFTRRLPNGAPWVAICVCGLAWTLSLGLSFERLIMIDILLYGASLLLEFVALILLRIREPGLARPFRIPGGIPGCVLLSLGPALLLGVALVRNRSEQLGGISSLAFGLVLMLLGAVLYAGSSRLRRRHVAVAD